MMKSDANIIRYNKGIPYHYKFITHCWSYEMKLLLCVLIDFFKITSAKLYYNLNTKYRYLHLHNIYIVHYDTILQLHQTEGS